MARKELSTPWGEEGGGANPPVTASERPKKGRGSGDWGKTREKIGTFNDRGEKKDV